MAGSKSPLEIPSVRFPIIIRPKAEADLHDARHWYDLQRPGLGDEFLDEIELAIERLAKNPESRPIYHNGFRRLLTRRFPYKLFYRVENGRVIVFRILHAKRDHRRWL
jgi:plasmid stabilization system protein ParE